MKKAFTLIEVLIAIFVLALALLGIAAVFANTTRSVVQNYDEIQGRSVRRSADAYYPFMYRENDLTLGWNIQYNTSLNNDYKILYLTYRNAGMPDTVVVAAYKGTDSAVVTTIDDYRPTNNDVVVSYLGFSHRVVNNDLQIQKAESDYQIIVLPYEKMNILDIHRWDAYP